MVIIMSSLVSRNTPSFIAPSNNTPVLSSRSPIEKKDSEEPNINTLPIEILSHIFHLAVGLKTEKKGVYEFGNEDRVGDQKVILSIRFTCHLWSDIAQKYLLTTLWNHIIKLPIYKRLPPTGKQDFSPTLESFKSLSAGLASARTLLVPGEYKQFLLDESLKKVWPIICRQINFEANPIPQDVKAIRAWLNDPANATVLNQILGLDFSNLNLRFLPPEIGKLTELQRLYLNNNLIVEIPAEIGKLTKLQELVLHNNKIREIPAEIGELTELQELSLDGNQIIKIPEEIGKLTALRRLYLSNNQIAEIPIEIRNLSQLEELELDNNQMKKCTNP